MKLTASQKNTIYSLLGFVATSAGVALVTKLAELPAFQAYSPFLLAIGTFLLGKQHAKPAQ